MTMKLYGIPMSTAVARVLACLYEKDAEFELVPVSLAGDERKQPSYLAKNPFGQIPALDDGDLTLFESRAITKYITYKHKDQGPELLRTHDLAEASMVNVWMEVESQNFNTPISTIMYQTFLKDQCRTHDEELLKSSIEKLGKVLDVYEDRLSKCKYLAGDFYSLADLHHLPYLHYMMKTLFADLINSRPHVNKWWEDISSRPASKKVADGMTFTFGKD